ncbi:hypothetical protein QJQ45_020696, partial [Haematococcus lacustris]
MKPKHGVCTLLSPEGKPVNLLALLKHLPSFEAVTQAAVASGGLSVGQTARLLRKGCRSLLLLVQPGSESDKEGWHKGSLVAAVAGCKESSDKDKPELVTDAELQAVLDEYSDVFQDMPPGLPPDRGRPYKLSPKEEAEVKRQVSELQARGLIEPSSSPYGAPVLFVEKKDGSLRMCVDYRALNKLTVKDRYPLPRIDDLFDKLAGKKVFSSLDLQSGYHQIRISEADRPKTAFLTPMGQFQFKVLCLGLTNAPATFQRVMNNVFRPLINKSVLVYIDDILVMSNTAEEHVRHLKEVLELMRQHKLNAKRSKCEFNKTELAFLGHIAFLGLANYFRRFIPNFSSLAAPLTNLTSKQVAAAYDWEHFGGSELEAFDGLKEALCSAPVLALPDFSKPFVVCTDASLVGTGGVLMQDGRPIAYTSKKMSPAEMRYATGEQELLGIIRAVREWSRNPALANEVALTSSSSPHNADSEDAMTVIMTLSSRAEGLIYAIATRRTAARLRESAELGQVAALEAAQRAGQLAPPDDLAAAHTPGQARMTSAHQKGAQPGDALVYMARCVGECEELCAQLPLVPSENKSSAKKPAGLLQPLPIPERPWDSVSMDLIVKLPASGPNKYDSILVFVDRLTNMVHLVKTWESMTATQYAKLFLEHVFRLHGMPRSVVSDRGPQFHNKFWAEVTKLLQVQVNPSSAYHPETDGQTERVIEEMLRHFIRPDQLDWGFAINNAWQESVRSTPFYLSYGYHPRLAELLDLPQKVPQAHDFVKGMKTAVEQARQCLARAQKRMKSHQDNKRREVLYLPGDMVLLSTQNMRGKADQPGVRKLKPRYVGPFSVQYMVGKAAVKLWLPDEWSRLHNVFHVSLVKPYRTDASGAVPRLAGPPPVQWLDGEPQYTVEKVVGHRLEPSKGKRKGKSKKRRLEFKWSCGMDTWRCEAHWHTCAMMPIAHRPRKSGTACCSGPTRMTLVLFAMTLAYFGVVFWHHRIQLRSTQLPLTIPAQGPTRLFAEPTVEPLSDQATEQEQQQQQQQQQQEQQQQAATSAPLRTLQIQVRCQELPSGPGHGPEEAVEGKPRCQALAGRQAGQMTGQQIHASSASSIPLTTLYQLEPLSAALKVGSPDSALPTPPGCSVGGGSGGVARPSPLLPPSHLLLHRGQPGFNGLSQLQGLASSPAVATDCPLFHIAPGDIAKADDTAVVWAVLNG